MSARPTKTAPQLLIGTWRSDRKRTEAQWVWPKKLAAARRQEFFAIFGHLVHRFTRQRCFTTYEGKTTSAPYRVLWHGVDVFPQLVLLYRDQKGERVQHIIFDREDSYYVQGGKCAEFFRRKR